MDMVYRCRNWLHEQIQSCIKYLSSPSVQCHLCRGREHLLWGPSGEAQGSSNQGPESPHLITDDSTTLCSVSETTVWRAMASRVASCFFFRLFRLCEGDHSCVTSTDPSGPWFSSLPPSSTAWDSPQCALSFADMQRWEDCVMLRAWESLMVHFYFLPPLPLFRTKC